MATSLASTSGTVGQTVLSVTDIIEHAVRRCGVLASLITAEQQQSARDNLFLILSNLATRGLSLWCVQRYSFATRPGVAEYVLPVGTVDVLQALLRYGTRTPGVWVPAGALSMFTCTFDGDTRVDNVTVTPAASGVYRLRLGYSTVSAAGPWTDVGPTGPATDFVVGGAPLVYDALDSVSARFWRVVDQQDPTRVLTSSEFTSSASDTPMAKFSRDSFATMPNKHATTARPLQYWYDKQFYQPKLTLWPVPSEASTIQLFLQRQIQDPGAYTNAVEVPQRWLDAVISLLAPRVCLELPKEFVPPDRYNILAGIAEKALREAEDSETDGAPIMLAPNISCYTR